MSTPRVAVVILTWNDGELLDAALASALASTGVDVEVVVVDNGSEPPATVPADARVLLLRNEANRGVAAARNQGAGATDAPLVLFLDSDARLHPDTLERLCRPMAASPDVALVAPVFDGQAPEASAGRAPSLGRKVARVLGRTAEYAPAERRPGDPAWDVDFAIGACQLVRRAAFDEVEGLDEAFFYGPEDVDFCLRLRDAGWRVVQVPGAGCHHPPRRRHRRLLTRAGARHAWAVSRHLWRHRDRSRPLAPCRRVPVTARPRPAALDVVVVGYRSEDVVERCVRAARQIPGCASVIVVD
ncbi:MAG TPA: glycosyltransferase, partial [Acidimicrobiales bacterium]|nr:glycosyltransferase [Acidimicrobiales bacterium]